MVFNADENAGCNYSKSDNDVTGEKLTLFSKVPNIDNKAKNTYKKIDLLKAYLDLAKFRLTALVAISAVAGYGMAPKYYGVVSFMSCCIGVTLTSSCANSVNQYFEVEFDAQMNRTKNRPIVKKVLSRQQGLKFALSSGVAGALILLVGSNLLTALLGVANIFLYTHLYTPMKRTSIANTWVGSVVGAIPPMMGWTAATGQLGLGAWLLGAILFTWQFPHFCALSWNLRNDYSKAGYKMMSVVDPNLCRSTAFEFSICLAVVTMLFPISGVTSWTFAILSTPVNLQLIKLSWNFYKTGDNLASKSLFKFTLGHLPALFICMSFCKL